MRRPKYHLSPNEVERYVKEDQERRRKLRIIQVREQSKTNAALIRNDVRREKQRLLGNFVAEIKEKLDAEKEEALSKLEQKYENTLRTIGEGHREALEHGDGDSRAEKLQKQMEEKAAAQERYKLALDRQRKEDSEKVYEKTKHIIARQTALEKEKQRAAEIACLPPPPPDIIVELEKTKKRAIPMTDTKAFSTTHYHIPDYHVVRADSKEQLYDAREEAEDADLRLKQDLEEKERCLHERIERARIRGNEALQKELMKNEYDEILKELSFLQKQDQRRRKKMLSEIPRQVHLPPECYLEEREEKQREMEDMVREILKQDLNEAELMRFTTSPAQQDSPDLPASPSAEDAAVTPEINIPVSKINPALRDLTNAAQHAQNIESKKTETVLKQLMNRIKKQRGSSLTEQKAPLKESIREKPITEKVKKATFVAQNKAVWEAIQDDSPKIHKSQPKGQGSLSTDQGRDQEVVMGATSNTERIIEDLRKRIEEIEAQKEELAMQFKVQSSSQHHHVTNLAGNQKQEREEESSSLEEVDIDAFSDPHVKGHVQGDSLINGIASSGTCLNRNLGVATSMWTNLRGTGSNMEEVGLRGSGSFVGRDSGIGSHQGGQLPVRFGDSEWAKLDGGDAVNSSYQAPFGGGLGSLHQLTSLHQPHMSLLSVGATSAVLGALVGQGEMLPGQGEKLLGHGHGGNREVNESTSLLTGNANLMKKLKEYTERAGERHIGMDAETMRKVREYQQKLLQTHEMRKKLLADVKADIENRRRELYASSNHWPTFSGDNVLAKQPVTGGMGSFNINSMMSGDQMVTANRGIISDGDSHLGWQPTQFISDTRESMINHSFLTSQITGDGPLMKNFKDPIVEKVGKEKKVEVNAVGRQTNGAGDQDKIRKVIKSLSFDDEESINTSCLSWKDVLTDADSTKLSQTLADDSRITNEEERGSPILQQAHTSGKTSSSMTDNTVLNGSALLVQAQERKQGFEHRQNELQNQLMDIQRQKDAIMQAYHSGQQALQQQQLALMSKLATASALVSSDKDGKQQEAARVKLAGIRSQIDSDAQSRSLAQWAGYGFSAGLVRDAKTYSGKDDAGLGDAQPKSRDSLNESRDIDRTAVSNQSSRSRGGTPGNLSLDSYLADISFQKIRSATDGRTTQPASAFQPFVSSANSATSSSRPLAASQSLTWASVLSSSSSQEQPFNLHQQSAQIAHDKISIGHFSAPIYQHIPSINQGKDNLTTGRSIINFGEGLYDNQTLSPLSNYQTLLDHRPHELSTILEVDTPSSHSTRHLGTSTANTITSSLSTQSNNWNLLSSSTGVRIDIFRDPPYIFREGGVASHAPAGAVYNLASDFEDTSNVTEPKPAMFLGQEISNPGDQKQMKAQRSLDFSEQLSDTSMPALVELTPLKAQDDDEIEEKTYGSNRALSPNYTLNEDSSFKISGYSDHLRFVGFKEVSKALDEENVSNISGSELDRFSVENSGNNANSDSIINNKACESEGVAFVLQHAQGFNQDVVEGLRQQSEVVFCEVGDVASGSEISGWLGGGSSHVGSVLTGGGSSNDISGLSLGMSSLTAELEEISITETVGDTGDE